MADEQNIKEGPNLLIKKKCAAGIKPLLVEKNCSSISLLVNCFLIGCCVVPPLSLKREIGWRNGTEGKKN